MKFTAILSASLLSASTLAAPSTITARKNVPIDFASCVSSGLNLVRKTHPDASLLWARFTSAHFGVVQHVLALDVLQLTFDSESAGGAIVLQTRQEAPDSSDSMGCIFEKERLVPGHTITGAAPVNWPADVPVGIVAADEVLLKTKTWKPFNSVTLGKMFGAEQATYSFDMIGSKVKVGAKDSKIVTGGGPVTA